ncbi:MAG TPA: divergent PAP2 family protein [Clostridia bacterium]|mgnify:CR=1 FL=1|nr:divergent PAP2 family protein [Clostridia bacterium]
MDFREIFFTYKYLTIPFVSWVAAQALKFIIDLIVRRKIDYRRLLGSGGMPSSHSAFVVSLSTVVGIGVGFESALFGVTLAFSLIVIYDAAGVRRAAGKQAKVLNRMFHHNKGKGEFHLEEDLKELIGHTPVEVIAGALLGLAISVLLLVVVK